MKVAKSCLQCRVNKRKCAEGPKGPNTPCLACSQRSIQCSKSAKLFKSQRLVPQPSANIANYAKKDVVSALPHEAINEFVDHYMRYIHDRPQSLFHEKTLWEDIRMGKVTECLLMAICATGCRFSKTPYHCGLGSELRMKSSHLFSQQIETVSLQNVQTCILLANLYAAEQNNNLEALYFGIANRMAHILKLHESQIEDHPIIREIKCRVWWTLFIADRWCPPGLGLPREIAISSRNLDLPMDEVAFQKMDTAGSITFRPRSDGMWKYMVTLTDILGPIQDLNHSLVHGHQSRADVDRQVFYLAERLEAWHDTLPPLMIMNDDNLNRYRREGHGGTFVALHFGYHHYSTLLYFQFLDEASGTGLDASFYTERCRFHALSFSRLLEYAQQREDCQVVYLTVAYMTMVSSSVLLHMLLFGNDTEVDVARVQLTRNFEALVELRKYWPHMETITQRLLTFQNACLRAASTKTYKVDKWMVRFLLEHGLPLGEKQNGVNERATVDLSSPSVSDCEVPSDRRKLASEAFEDLCVGSEY